MSADGTAIDGGSSDDLIDGTVGRETLRGGDGNDRIDGVIGSDSISGGTGNDVLTWGASGGNGFFAPVLDGGSGNDLLTGIVMDLGQVFLQTPSMFGGSGDDTLRLCGFEPTPLTINGGSGFDTVSLADEHFLTDRTEVDLNGFVGADMSQIEKIDMAGNVLNRLVATDSDRIVDIARTSDVPNTARGLSMGRPTTS